MKNEAVISSWNSDHQGWNYFYAEKNGYKTDGESGIYATKINMYQKRERETICKFQIHTK